MACMDFEDYGFTYYKLKSDIDQAIEKVRRDMEKAGMSGDYIAKNLIVPLLNLRNAGECETNELKGYKEAASHCHVLASSRPPVIDEFTDFNRVLNKFSSYKSWRLLEEDVKMDNPEYVMERYDQLKGAQKFIIDYYFGQEVKEVMSQIPK